jgi:hypothetical protein
MAKTIRIKDPEFHRFIVRERLKSNLPSIELLLKKVMEYEKREREPVLDFLENELWL